MKKRVKIGLALSGGGALGFAHLGVIKALNDNGINIDMITGTSIGAVVGAIYASNSNLTDVFNIAKKVKSVDIFDINFNPSGVLSGKSASKIITNMLKNKTFDECKIPFKCVATNLMTGEPVVFDKGDLITGVRASMSVPGIFTPVKFEHNILVDGGIVNNLPDNLLVDMGADFIIGVDLITNYSVEGEPKFIPKTLMYSFLLQQFIANKRRKNYSNVLIKPVQKECKQWIFNEESALIGFKAGYDATIKQIKKIKLGIEKLSK